MGNEELDIAQLAKKLMSDPAAIEMVSRLKESGMLGGTVGSPSEEPSTDAPVAAQSDISSVTGPSDGEAQGKKPSDIMGKLPEIIGVLAPLMGKSERMGNAEVEKRNRLLSALKPYLNDNRRGMIDTVMSLSQITDLIDIIPKDDKQ